MALIRWEPAREMASLQQEMNRLFSTFFDAPGASAANGTTGSPRRWVPAMDLVETDDHFVLRADLPGMDESDIDLSLEENVLTLSGERKAEHEEQREGFYRLERAAGTFSRSLTLPRPAGGPRAEREGRRGGCSRLERAAGTFSRSLTLPEGVEGDAINATFDKGVLEVRIPKPEQRKPRKLQIQVGDTPAAIEGRAAEQAATS